MSYQFFYYHNLWVKCSISMLRTFFFIAETGSLSQAAASVHRTQSAVSMQIRRRNDGKLIYSDEQTKGWTDRGADTLVKDI
jgi:hypothetical protein